MNSFLLHFQEALSFVRADMVNLSCLHLKDGVWAGHMELQAASLLLERNINIHQASQHVDAAENVDVGIEL